jgi:hypothetical protein
MKALKILAILLSTALFSAPASLYAGNTNADKLVLAGGKPATDKPKQGGGGDKAQECHKTEKGLDESKCPGGRVVIVEVCPNKPDKYSGCGE